MSETFDPYHKWLGIPPHEQPPNHYRLLAIDLFEDDPDVIASAADQRMAHVRTFQSGQHGEQSQAMLNAIAAARVCLLKAEKKTRYDEQLRASRAAEDPESALPHPAFAESLAAELSRRRRRLWPTLTGLAVGAVVCIVVAALAMRGGEEVAQGDPQPPPPKAPGDPHPSNPAVAPPIAEPPPAPDDPPNPDPDDPPEQITPQPEPFLPPVDPEPAPQAPPEPAAVPGDDALAAAEATLQPRLADATPQQMLAMATSGEHEPAECFFLLGRARTSAAEAGDATAAAQAEKELLVRFTVDPLQTQADTLLTLAKSDAAGAAAQSIAEGCTALVDSAVAAGDTQLATQLATAGLKAAREAGDTALEREATLKILQLKSP